MAFTFLPQPMKSFLDLQPYMLLPSVKDPLNHIHKAHCGVQEIVVDNKIDDAVIQAVSNAYLQSCVVILHISDDGILPKEGMFFILICNKPNFNLTSNVFSFVVNSL